MAQDNSVARLAALPIFSGLSPEAMDACARRIVIRDYEDGQWIVAHGDDDRDVFIILQGRLRVILFGESRELILDDLEPGALVGEMSAIDDRPRSASVIAVGAVVLVRLARQVFLELVHEHPSLCDHVLKVLVQRIRTLDRRVHELASMTVAERVRVELLRIARPAPGLGAGQAELQPDLTHAELAARIGTHREAVSREMSALTRRGLLLKQAGRLLVTDVRALSSLIGVA